MDGGGSEVLVVIERNPLVAALLRDSLWGLYLMADSGLGDDCDDETVSREAYFSKRIYMT